MTNLKQLFSILRNKKAKKIKNKWSKRNITIGLVLFCFNTARLRQLNHISVHYLQNIAMFDTTRGNNKLCSANVISRLMTSRKAEKGTGSHPTYNRYIPHVQNKGSLYLNQTFCFLCKTTNFRFISSDTNSLLKRIKLWCPISKKIYINL